VANFGFELLNEYISQDIQFYCLKVDLLKKENVSMKNVSGLR